jgi:hypothetical protein
MAIVDDVVASADWIAVALRSSGYNTDFTPASLWEIDRFFDEQAPNGVPVKDGLLSEQRGQRIFAVGSYVGEVIRRHLGGNWIGDDADPNAELDVTLKLGEDHLLWPIQRAMKRYSNGDEDGIAIYGFALGLPVGARPGSV